ncbi:MAG: FAD-binding oxidoreductase, partial [Proteobacteria bacterium]|nr:FAD-binding oxidoreductase [Pseudomonadota bacterium]
MTDIMTRLAALIDPAAIRMAGPSYLEEPRGRWQGKALGVATPGSAAEVAAILRLCSETGTPVIPYGGGTGLVGGQLAEEGTAPLILSLERMRAIRSFDAEAGTMTVEAGVILQEIHTTAEAQGWIFPLTLASQGSARLGGLLATNAGGVNVLRYGNARDLVLGVEAVLADGTVINTLSPLRKNNMGYDLR